MLKFWLTIILGYSIISFIACKQTGNKQNYKNNKYINDSIGMVMYNPFIIQKLATLRAINSIII